MLLLFQAFTNIYIVLRYNIQSNYKYIPEISKKKLEIFTEYESLCTITFLNDINIFKYICNQMCSSLISLRLSYYHITYLRVLHNVHRNKFHFIFNLVKCVYINGKNEPLDALLNHNI